MILSDQQYEQLSQTDPAQQVRVQTNLIGPNRGRIGKLIGAFSGAYVYADLGEIEMFMFDVPLHRNEHIVSSRHCGRVGYWRARTWRRWEIFVAGPCGQVQSFYRVVESIYERS